MDKNMEHLAVALKPLFDQFKAEIIGEIKSHVDQRFVALETSMDCRFNDIERDAATMRTILGNVSNDVKVLKTDVAVLKTDVAELKTDVAVLKTDVAELKTDVAVLKTDVAVLKTDVAELKTDMADVKADVSILKSDMGEVKSGMSDRRRASENHAETLLEHDRRLHRLEEHRA